MLFCCIALVALLLVERSAAQQSFPSSAFTPPEMCGRCHVDIYNQWSQSILANAFTDPFYRARMEHAVRDTDGALSDFCIRCHSPIGVFAGEHVPVDGSNMSDIATKGVQCDFCHTISGIDGVSNGSYINTPGNVKRGPFGDSVSPFHNTAYSILHTRSEVCGICHDIYNPNNGLQIEATYTEWKVGPYGKQGVTCQDCHMTPGVGVTKPNPGQAAIGGPQREHIFTHDFTGGNVLYGNRELAIERLQGAAQLALKLPPRAPVGDEAQLEVVVRNVGAGHYLPTSLTYVRQMWLDVRVRDVTGRELLADQVMYNTILEDADGVHDGTVSSWRAVRIYRDYRIPPAGEVTERFALTVPSDAQGPLSVTAVLNYRSADPTMTAAYGVAEFPIIEMTRQEASLELTAASPAASGIPTAILRSLWWVATAALLIVSLATVFWQDVTSGKK